MLLANFLPIVIACGFWFGFDGDRPALAGFIALILSSLIGVAVTAFFLSQKMEEVPGKWSWSSIWWEVTFSNIFALKDRVQPTIQYIPDIWAYLIKGLIPHLLIIVFVNSAVAKTADGESMFYHYGGYVSRPFQAMGIVTVIFTFITFLVGFAFPQIYAPLATAYEEENQEELKGLEDSSNSEEEVKVVKESEEEPDEVPAVAGDVSQ